jgi:hypothetical protein
MRFDKKNVICPLPFEDFTVTFTLPGYDENNTLRHFPMGIVFLL